MSQYSGVSSILFTTSAGRNLRISKRKSFCPFLILSILPEKSVSCLPKSYAVYSDLSFLPSHLWIRYTNCITKRHFLYTSRSRTQPAHRPRRQFFSYGKKLRSVPALFRRARCISAHSVYSRANLRPFRPPVRPAPSPQQTGRADPWYVSHHLKHIVQFVNTTADPPFLQVGTAPNQDIDMPISKWTATFGVWGVHLKDIKIFLIIKN